MKVSRAISELLFFIEKYHDHISVINLDDDLLMLNKTWFIEFALQYQKQIYTVYGIPYAINARANLIDVDVAEKLKESGCCLVRIGFESGDEEIRNRVLNKNISDAEMEKAFKLLAEYKIRTLAFAMIGVPGESRETIKASMLSLIKIQPTLIRLSFFEPFIGTPLYEQCVREKLFRNELIRNSTNCFETSCLKFNDLTTEEITLVHLLYPWFLNSLGGKETARYNNAIAQFRDYDFLCLIDSQTKQNILKIDDALSEELRKRRIGHFRYYEYNTNYIEYVSAD